MHFTPRPFWDDPAQQSVAHGHREDVAGGDHGLAFLDAFDVAEHDSADRVLVEVEGQADEAVLEAQHLVDSRAGQARHPGDAVADLENTADRGLLEARLEAVEVAADGGRYVFGVDHQIRHCGFCLLVRKVS